MKNKIKKIFKIKTKPEIRYSVCGKQIPGWCVGAPVNSWLLEISEEQRSKVRNWYLENTPDSCERTIGSYGKFGTQYYTATSIDGWGGFNLYVGDGVNVKLYVKNK